MKQLSKNLNVVFVTLFASLALSGCGSVKLNDHEWCGDLGPYGAKCNHTFSDEERWISKEEWDRERFGQVCGKAEAFAEFKSALLRLCRLSRRCTYEQKEALRRLGANLEELETLATEIQSGQLQ